MKRFCVYRHFDGNGNLLYVGCSWSIFMRTEAHKKSYWFNQIKTIALERFNTLALAMQAEKKAIATENPFYNGKKWIEQVKSAKGGMALSHTITDKQAGRLKCQKCKYKWIPRVPDPPVLCPKCKCRKWDK